MEDTNQPRLDQWTDFAGKFLKAEHISKFPVMIVCNDIEATFDDEGDANLFLRFVYNGKKWMWQCNKTNQKAIKDCGILKPLDLKMKKITFDKIQVRNPSTKQMVDSLIVKKVE